MSSIDLKAAFWHIPLGEKSKEKTTFAVLGRGLYEFNVLAFNLSNAAQVQQKLMDKLFGPKFAGVLFVYLDDVIVVTKTFSEHIEVLKEVFKRLKMANLTVNLEKCKFCRPTLKYLGFIVDSNGLRTDSDKVKDFVSSTSKCHRD